MNRDEFDTKFDAAVKRAEAWIELADLPEDTSDDDQIDALEERMHCGTCTVRGILDIVMEPVLEYLEDLERISR